jgi:hypothetical protein
MIEGIGHPQHRGELQDSAAVAGSEARELVVGQLRSPPRMETSDRSNPLHFFAIESRKGSMKDQVLSVAMMLRPTDGRTDVVKKRCAFQ